MIVEKNSVVGLRYILRNEKGEIVEDGMQGAPVYYLQGSAGISQRLQQQLEGAAQGERREVVLLTTLGTAIEQQLYEVFITEVRTALGEELLLGYPILANNKECDDQCECRDYNVDE